MIRSHNEGTPKRRIAIIQMPRPQRARMGSIGPVPPPPTAWTTISDETPESSANWIASIMQRQATARETTPGTLTYTPAATTPAPYVAPWNSWLSPNCPPAGATAAPEPATVKPTKWWLILGAIGAAASLKYLLSDEKEERRHR